MMQFSIKDLYLFNSVDTPVEICLLTSLHHSLSTGKKTFSQNFIISTKHHAYHTLQTPL